MPFQQAKLQTRHWRIVIYGGPGKGKTVAALSFAAGGPVAVLDLEDSSTLYADQFAFDVVRTRSIKEMEREVDNLTKNPGEYKTLVIDPITVLWQLLQDAGQTIAERRSGGDALTGTSLTFQEWGLIKRELNSLIAKVMALQMNIVFIAREAIEYEGQGQNLKKVGVRPDMDKGLAYNADVVLHAETEGSRHILVVEKARAGVFKVGQKLIGHDATSAGGFYAAHLAPISGRGPQNTAPVVDEQVVVGEAVDKLTENERASVANQDEVANWFDATYAGRARTMITQTIGRPAAGRRELTNGDVAKMKAHIRDYAVAGELFGQEVKNVAAHTGEVAANQTAR